MKNANNRMNVRHVIVSKSLTFINRNNRIQERNQVIRNLVKTEFTKEIKQINYAE